MRKVEFEVPSEIITDFSGEIVSRDLDNSIIDADDDGIKIEVKYEKDQTRDIEELEQILDDLIENMEDDDDESDE